MNRSSTSRRVRYGLAALVTLAALAAPSVASAASPNYLDTPTGTWTVNGPVRALAQDGNILWIGGKFTALSDRPATKPNAQVIPVSNLAAIDLTTGNPIPGLHIPAVTGAANSIVYSLTVADGKLFIGGIFSAVDGTARQNIAAVDSQTGALDPFHETIGTVWTMTADSSKLYVGGGFTKVGPVNRTRLAAFSFDGTLDPLWAPRLDQVPRDMSLSPDGLSIYVVGEFKNAAGPDGVYQPRNSAAKFDTNIGLLDPWVVGCPCSTELYGIGVQAVGDRVYVGMGGSDWAAALDATTGNQIWKTDTFGQVQDVEVDGDRLIIGGHFTYVAPNHDHGFICTKTGGNGCIFRNKMAALSLDGVLDQSWNPNMDGEYPGVWRVHVNGTDLWAGGAFNTVSGSWQSKLALFQDVPPGSPLFSDGFESGSISRWNNGDFGLVADTSNPLSGTYAARASATGGAAKYAYENISPAPAEAWYRIHFDVVSQNTPVTLLSFRQPGGTEIFRVFLQKTGKLATLDVGTHTTTTSTTGVSPGSWHELRVHLLSGSGGGADVTLDGSPVADLTVSDAFAVPGRFQLGDTVANRTYNVLYDDVDVSDAP
jgi:hypothetical protein